METPQLRTLMAAYYHQDWVEVGLWPTLDLYLEESDSDERAQLLLDIEAVLETTPETSVYDKLRGLGGYVLLDGHQGGYRGWLEEIAVKVSAVN